MTLDGTGWEWLAFVLSRGALFVLVVWWPGVLGFSWQVVVAGVGFGSAIATSVRAPRRRRKLLGMTAQDRVEGWVGTLLIISVLGGTASLLGLATVAGLALFCGSAAAVVIPLRSRLRASHKPVLIDESRDPPEWPEEVWQPSPVAPWRRTLIGWLLSLAETALALWIASLLFDGLRVDAAAFVVVLIFATLPWVLFSRVFASQRGQVWRRDSPAAGGCVMLVVLLVQGAMIPLLIADWVLRGFNIDSWWTFAGTVAVLYAVSIVLSRFSDPILAKVAPLPGAEVSDE